MLLLSASASPETEATVTGILGNWYHPARSLALQHIPRCALVLGRPPVMQACADRQLEQQRST